MSKANVMKIECNYVILFWLAKSFLQVIAIDLAFLYVCVRDSDPLDVRYTVIWVASYVFSENSTMCY